MGARQSRTVASQSSGRSCELSDRERQVKIFLDAIEEAARDMGTVHDDSWRARIRNGLDQLLRVVVGPSVKVMNIWRKPKPPEPFPKPLPQRIHGRKFLEHLGDLGIIHKADLEKGIPSDYVRRVIIDAGMSGPVVLYVERYGDERLLSVRWEEGGYEVREK